MPRGYPCCDCAVARWINQRPKVRPPVFFFAMDKNYTAARVFLNLNDTLFLGGTFSLIDAAPRRQAGRMQSPPKPWNPHCADLGRLTHVLIILEEIYLCVLYSDPYIAAVYPTYYAIYVKYLWSGMYIAGWSHPPQSWLTLTVDPQNSACD